LKSLNNVAVRLEIFRTPRAVVQINEFVEQAGRIAGSARERSVTMPAFHRVARLDFTVRRWRWAFADERRSEISAHFAALRVKTPALWNGRILLGRNPMFDSDCFRAEYFETDFASFLAWRDWGFPDKGVFNGFGMGALRGNDGAFMLGEMAASTANAGRIYFPSGTPDLSDVKDGALDIAGSILREVEEETGLDPSTYRADPGWYCVVAGPLIAVIQLLDVDMPGETLRVRIAQTLAGQRSPELRAIHLVRGPEDFTPAMPVYVTAFIDHVASMAV
jgi:8-oxo-dGTP pyrophosphatase MutT (NUDIX family)